MTPMVVVVTRNIEMRHRGYPVSAMPELGSKPFFEELLATFAEEAGADCVRVIVLAPGEAGWHDESNP